MIKDVKWISLVALLLFLFYYCGKSSPPERCIKVSSEKLQAIESGLNYSGGSLREGWAVKSKDFKSVYFIAAEMDGPGFEGDGDIGLWSSNSLDNGMIMSINHMAQEFSDWPAGKDTDAEITTFDDGSDEAERCVLSHQK